MKVLLLGGTGVLSQDILGELISHNEDTYVLNRGNHKSPYSANPHYHSITGNVRQIEKVNESLKDEKFDCIVDFLSYTPEHLRSSYSILSSKCKQYVFISSCVAFRRAQNDMPITEESPMPNYNWSYSINKYECEKEIRKLYEQYHCPYTIVRPYITYGNTRIPFGLAPLARYHWTLIGRVKSCKPFIIWKLRGGTNMCSLLRTEDFAKIFYNMLNNPLCYNEDFNLTAEVRQTWREVVNMMYEVVGQDPKGIVEVPVDYIVKALPEFKETLLGDRILPAIFDTSKLRRVIPAANEVLDNAITLREGIKRTVEYYENNNYLSGIDYIFDARLDRMLSKYLPHNDPRRKTLHFNSYGLPYTNKDKRLYWIYRNFPLTLINVLRKIYNKIKR